MPYPCSKTSSHLVDTALLLLLLLLLLQLLVNSILFIIYMLLVDLFRMLAVAKK